MTEAEILKKYGKDFGWYEHMITHCETAMEGVEITKTLDAFAKNRLVFGGVVMSLLALGELMKDLPDKYKFLDDNEVSKIIGFRNRSAHGYNSLSPKIVRDTALINIPEILQKLKRLQLSEKS